MMPVATYTIQAKSPIGSNFFILMIKQVTQLGYMTGMNKIKKEIECIARLNELSSCIDEMLAFMLLESLITKEEIAAVKRSPDQAKSLQAHLAAVSSSNKIQLLEYQWDYLPVERLKILIVTDRNQKEFSYNF